MMYNKGAIHDVHVVEKNMKEDEKMNLVELTGKESGAVIYDNNTCVICNWSGIEGFPMISPIGIMGDGREVPEVEPEFLEVKHIFEDLDEIYSTADFDVLPDKGWVYDLGDTVVITFDDWN